jgi:sugar/nucleoside kinase (ribokinase family)
MAIVAVGSLAYDSIRTPSGSKERILGGSLTHFSNAAAFLSKPRLVGVVGDDFGEPEWDFIRRKSSAIDGVSILKGEKSFFWKGYYTKDFDSAITEVTELNAFAKFKPVVPESYRNDDYLLFLANIDPKIQLDVAKQCKNSKLIILDTMNYWIKSTPDALKEAMKNVDGVIINEGEAELLSGGEKNMIKAAEALFLPNFKILILKRGSHGVMIFGRDFLVTLPAFPVKDVIDPTGAGDSFAGAFVSYIDSNNLYDFDRDGIKRAAAYATIVASYSVQGFGVDGIDVISPMDIDHRLKEFQSIASF